jgi:hypothetical protein
VFMDEDNVRPDGTFEDDLFLGNLVLEY